MKLSEVQRFCASQPEPVPCTAPVRGNTARSDRVFFGLWWQPPLFAQRNKLALPVAASKSARLPPLKWRPVYRTKSQDAKRNASGELALPRRYEAWVRFPRPSVILGGVEAEFKE